MQMINAPTKRSDVHNTGGTIIAAGDIVAIIISYFIATWISGDTSLSGTNTEERVYIYSLIGVAGLLFFLSHGHYTQRIPWWNQVRLLCATAFVSALGEGFLDFLVSSASPPSAVILNWTLWFFAIILLRLLFFRIRASTTHWNVSTALIGDAQTVTDILYALNADPGTGYDVKAVLIREDKGSLTPEELPRRYASLTIEPYEIYEEFIEQNPNHFYIFVPDVYRSAVRDEIADKLNSVGACYAISPSASKMGLYEMEPSYFFGYDVMLMMVRASLSHPVSSFLKRAIDIVLSGIALMFFLPAFAIICIILKIEGHEGSLFYSGERIGQKGRLFKCWKFRTMRPNSDHLLEEYLEKYPQAREHWEKYFKLPYDPRVQTRTARFLRKSSLDEIPQLFNVLIGNMSLVGPRPILPNEAEPYGEALSEYIKVKPGITGLWQVSGRNAVTFQRRIYWDCWYVRNWSIWGDTVIMLKTIPTVLLRNDGH